MFHIIVWPELTGSSQFVADRGDKGPLERGQRRASKDLRHLRRPVFIYNLAPDQKGRGDEGAQSGVSKGTRLLAGSRTRSDDFGLSRGSRKEDPQPIGQSRENECESFGNIGCHKYAPLPESSISARYIYIYI